MPRGPLPRLPPEPDDEDEAECWNCGCKGHYSWTCKRPIQCHKCFEVGHYGHSCPANQAAPTLASSIVSSATAATAAVVGGLSSVAVAMGMNLLRPLRDRSGSGPSEESPNVAKRQKANKD